MDVWKKFDRFQKKNTKEWRRRKDFHVLASAHERCIYINGIQHNVGTIEAYIEDLKEACKFVQDKNPVWWSCRWSQE